MEDDDRLVAGRYRLRRPVGRGGMGIVWAARDEVLNRDVAVKEVLLPSDLDERQHDELRERTLREARAAARISSDAALTVYDVVESDDRPWIVMELLEPRTLADELADRGRLTEGETAAVALAVLDALEAAHAAGVLHRDVKPGNVMLRGATSTRPRYVLADFGIAHLDGDPTVTSTGMVVGSPAYVAPERARGQPATPASDLWSLGVTLWACVEGAPPFQREGPLPTLTAVVTEDVPEPQHAGPLAPLLRALLVKDPAARADLQTARRLVQEAEVSASAVGTPVVPAPESGSDAEPEPDPESRSDAEPEPERGPVSTSTYPPSRPGRRGRVALAGAALALAVGALLLALRPWDDGTTAPDVAASPAPAATEPSPGPTQDATVEPTQQPQTEATEGGGTEGGGTGDSDVEGAGSPEGELPDGFVRYEDETGFSVAVPEGWESEREGPRVYLRDPSSSAYLLVDQTDDPADDPLVDWQQQEQTVSQRLEEYERLRLEAADYRGWEAADWEFVHGDGQSVRVLNRNVVTAEDQAYALYWSVPASEWEERWPTFEVAAETFTPRA